jgi:RNA polymerase sigma-70 factor (ECF subfamily)
VALSPVGLLGIREKLLVRRLQQRDERAFQEMVRLYQHKVWNLVYRMMGNREEAEDVAQDVFVTVLKAIDSFRGESKFSTWLYRIAVNQCKNRLKYLGRRSYQQTGSLEDSEAQIQAAQPSLLQPHTDGPEQVLEGRQMEALLQQGIAALEEEHRTLLVLRDVEELSYQEIASITSLPEGTVKSRIHRARMALKEHLARHFEPAE